MFLRHLKVCLISLILTSCATMDRSTSIRLRQLVTNHQYDEAIQILNTSNLAQNPKSKLLYYTEIGLILHYQGDYVHSLEAFNYARDIIDELYTTRISSKIESSITNDNADYYYGEKYEASLVYFYLALTHYMQANLEIDSGKRNESLFKAIAEIKAWDSFLTEMKQERLGQVIFKDDLLSKTFGALVHEAIGTRNGDQIALQLYKDAFDVYFKNYNLFPTYNFSFQAFRENFENFPNMPISDIEQNYVRETSHSLALKDFLTGKILLLTKNVNPNHLKKEIEKLNPSEKIIKSLNTKGGNVSFLIQDGLIIEKKARLYEFPIILPGHTGIAYSMLGNKITFELPYVEAPSYTESGVLQALDTNGNIVSETQLSIVAPLADLAAQAINEHSSSIATKTGARVAAKHIAAAMAAQAAYESSKDRNPTFALMALTIGHGAAIAAINESEKADIRFWSTLPSTIRMGNLTLRPGNYRFRAILGSEGSSEFRVMDLGEKNISINQLGFVTNKRNQSADLSIASQIIPQTRAPSSLRP
jgi:hypothetical protein